MSGNLFNASRCPREFRHWQSRPNIDKMFDFSLCSHTNYIKYDVARIQCLLS